ncbi:methionine aminopeptidase 1 [Trichomonascus vanleenenianus]|uniref:methionine aminopeptidase MAP1 n=1 Tax=Trichomonascus vanleenenianus TaxID=2268995 RepID=UPI003EC96D6B
MTVCSREGCENEANSLKCPTCLKNGLQSYFCGQECFKKGWAVHKLTHPVSIHDPFPSSVYTGELRAQYPLAPRRPVKEGIVLPDYAKDGQPRSEQKYGRTNNITALDQDGINTMRKVSKLAREVLDIAAAAARPGITTEEIDEIVHNACMERDAYPSPLNYYLFPKSVCTSINEVICHGIPDKRKLQDGDIVNLDITLYKDGYHSDLNETYYIGDKAKCNPDVVRLVETTREALDLAIAAVKPGALVRSFGDIIEAHAKKNNLSVIRTFVGHGVNQLFHCAPNVPHYAKNKAVGVCKPGMTFTIEPMLALGTWQDSMWPDNWTAVTKDGKWSAQFEHTLLVTEDGVEVLTARKADSPGGALPRI